MKWQILFPFTALKFKTTEARCILINKYIGQSVTINMQMYVPTNEIKITCHYTLVVYAQTSMVPLMFVECGGTAIKRKRPTVFSTNHY